MGNRKMSDDLNKTGKADRDKINIHQSHELNYWASKFEITHDELKDAVEQAGEYADDVKAYLGK